MQSEQCLLLHIVFTCAVKLAANQHQLNLPHVNG